MAAAPLALALLACANGAPRADSGSTVPDASRSADAPAADSLRGTVRVVGSEPATQVVLEPAGGGASVTLQGQRAVLLRLSGLEVAVEGEPEAPSRFRVARVTVRAANGIAAVDGVLAREGGGYVLRTPDGRRVAVPHLPEALAGRVGARVFLAGPLDRHPDSFGVIEEAP
jgi:hypothetical protein